MDLARDLFTVGVGPDAPTNAELVAAVTGLGYGATIQQDTAPIGADTPSEERGALPAIVQAALDQARREGKLIFIDFYADWCGPCQRMLQETFPDPRVAAELKEHFVFLKVDTDRHPDVSRWFKVQGIPDARILDQDGQERGRAVGFKTVEQTLAFLRGE